MSLAEAHRVSTRPVACGCGRDAVESFGESKGPTMRWWAAIRCDHCGATCEADGGDALPADMRARFIADFGSVGIAIRGGPIPEIMRRLRALLDLEMPAALALKRQLPGPVLTGSTHGEAERIRAALVDIAEVTIVPDEPA